MKSNRVHIRLNLWLEKDDAVVFGHGRVQLLKKISELGSLKKAAEELGMSYRGAWGKIRATESVLEDPLIEKISNREGYRLTPLGESMLRQYEEWHRQVEIAAAEKAKEIFSFPVLSSFDNESL